MASCIIMGESCKCNVEGKSRLQKEQYWSITAFETVWHRHADSLEQTAEFKPTSIIY